MLWLPTEEYAGLCSAIRTSKANKIPNDGYMLYRNHLYAYTCNADTDEILCTGMLIIECNQRIINGLIKKQEERENANKNRK